MSDRARSHTCRCSCFSAAGRNNPPRSEAAAIPGESNRRDRCSGDHRKRTHSAAAAAILPRQLRLRLATGGRRRQETGRTRRGTRRGRDSGAWQPPIHILKASRTIFECPFADPLVFRTVVNHDTFDPGMRLRLHARQGLGKKVRLVVAGDDDRNQWLFTQAVHRQRRDVVRTPRHPRLRQTSVAVSKSALAPVTQPPKLAHAH